MTDERLLAGMLLLMGVAVCFGLTVLFFGFVVLTGALLAVVGLALLAVGRRRRAAFRIVAVAGLTISRPLIYAGLADVQST